MNQSTPLPSASCPPDADASGTTPSQTAAPEVDLRSLMAGFPTGVGVLTTLGSDGLPRGMTCSSLCSIALRPATLLVCLRTVGPTLSAALERGGFALNLLHEQAGRVSELFASGAHDRFDHVDWRLPLGAHGPHLTADVHATADCLIDHTVAVGDHTVIFGTVHQVTIREDAAEPLLYGRRRYARWSDAAAVPAHRAMSG
ncbi:Flavin reductase-like protein [Frankia canadensis]|uniref:Flavin reductase-like protein n=2 Tax=Frankia canadensis TaxID=1836972 RepID=A0A2I2L276_9ACTN|nr:Flavin reductase-like protein [Frankia canadensis]SOU59298.1 Flavin reductase-like protein [Frankia canadensis]